MSDFETETSAAAFGSGGFEFGEWTTPFTNAAVEILEVAYAARGTEKQAAFRAEPPMSDQHDRDLVARIHARDSKSIYHVVFPAITAMRLLDEGGLLEFWQKTRYFWRPSRSNDFSGAQARMDA